MNIKEATPDLLKQFQMIRDRIIEKQNLQRDSSEEFRAYNYATKDGTWEYVEFEGAHESISRRGLTGTWCVYEILENDALKIQFNGIAEEAFLSIQSDF